MVAAAVLAACAADDERQVGAGAATGLAPEALVGGSAGATAGEVPGGATGGFAGRRTGIGT